jgi:UDP-glucose 4-epimerase
MHCDLSNSVELTKVFEKFKVSAVMHFAAFSLVGESVTNPLKYF